jgi:hypothetical protein
MLRYSRWRPDGGYDYFEANGFAALGNDLPNPVMPSPTRLGVPSVEVGQPIPEFSWKIGSGPLAIGIIAPMDTSFLRSGVLGSAFLYMLLGGGIVACAWGAFELLRSRRLV